MTIDELKILSMSEDYEDRSKAALNDNCPTEILDRLSSDEVDKVRMHVSDNPNTSPEKLVILSTDKMWEARDGVAQNPNTPIAGLENLFYDKVIENREDAIRNPNVTSEVVSSLVSSDNFNQMVLGAMSEKCSYEDFVTLVNYSSSNEEDVAYMEKNLTRNIKLPFHLFQEFIEKDKYFLRLSSFIGVDKEIHSDKHLTAIFDAFTDSVKYLGVDNSYYARREQAKSLSSKPELLEKLADDEMEEVRAEIAMNLNTPTHVFNKLNSDDAGFIIKHHLERNPSSPFYNVEVDKDERSRQSKKDVTGYDYFDYIANHPNASGELLDRVYRLDLDNNINSKVATHKNTLFSTLKLMEIDLEKDTRIYKEVIKELERGSNEAQDKNTSAERLKQLSKSKHQPTRCYVAKNSNTNIETLKYLSADKNKHVRYYGVQNPSNSLEVLKIFSDDEHEFIRNMAAQNKNASIEIINKVFKNNEEYRNLFIGLHKDTTFEKATEISKKYLTSWFKDYRGIWLYIDSTPTEKLEEIYNTLTEGQKYKVAISKNASFATLKLLAAEDKYFFKEYVYHHPNCTEEFKLELYKEIQQARDLRLIAIQKAEEEATVASRNEGKYINTMYDLIKPK